MIFHPHGRLEPTGVIRPRVGATNGDALHDHHVRADSNTRMDDDPNAAVLNDQIPPRQNLGGNVGAPELEDEASYRSNAPQILQADQRVDEAINDSEGRAMRSTLTHEAIIAARHSRCICPARGADRCIHDR